ncbi:MAG TPA: hypothetical protein VFT60_12430 [Bryobacteraceae bacterium]|nr:hypothetical protein [Bryobacteraceae bacterium]
MKRASIIAIAASAILSLSFTLYAGRRNPSVLLMSLFAVWVLAPFAGMLWIQTFRILELTIAILSPALYGYIALGPPRQRRAATFLIVPLASWLLIVAVAIIERRSKRT